MLKKLSTEEIKAQAPVVFTEQASNKVSKGYVHIPTYQIIQDMNALGWEVCDAKQIKTRAERKRGYQKHMIKFFNPNIQIQGNEGDNAFPQILITNSHDGTNSFKFQAGIFRLVCSNGLVIMSEDFGQFSIRHLGYSFEELRKTIGDMVEKLPNVVVKINQFRECVLTDDQMVDFALKAATKRFKNTVKINAEELLLADRPQDKGNDLWSVFNRVQEKLINGGIISTNTSNKTRKVRPIKNFNQDLKLNQELWELAESYIN